MRWTRSAGLWLAALNASASLAWSLAASAQTEADAQVEVIPSSTTDASPVQPSSEPTDAGLAAEPIASTITQTGADAQVEVIPSSPTAPPLVQPSVAPKTAGAERSVIAPAAVPRSGPAAPLEEKPEVNDTTKFGLRLSGLVQVDAVLWNQASSDQLDPSTGEPLNEDRFVLRSARVRADSEYEVLRGHVTIDANTVRGPAVRVLEAELGAGWPPAPQAPWIAGALGLFLIPFGFETLEPETQRLFLEPSQWVRAIFPGRRDLGARLEGKWLFLRYQVAVMNGNPSSDATFPLRDPNRAKDVICRLGVDGELAQALRIRVGSSLMLGTGFHPGRASSKDTLAWRDANEDGLVQTTELQVIAGAPAEASKNFDRFALGGDFELDAEVPVLGPLRLYGEVVWAKNADRGLFPADPIATGRDQRELGFTTGIRVSLTRHVEVGVRYDHYQPDFDATDQQGATLVAVDSSFSTIAVAAALCSLPGGRLTLEYDRNHNPLGRSASGQPTTLASDVLTLRGQMEL